MRKFLLIVLSVAVLCTACQKLEERMEQYPNDKIKKLWTVKQDKEGNYIQHGKCTSWYENGRKKEEARWKDGKPHGKYIEWYANRQKKAEIEFRNGIRHGKFISWQKNGKENDKGKFPNYSNLAHLPCFIQLVLFFQQIKGKAENEVKEIASTWKAAKMDTAAIMRKLSSTDFKEVLTAQRHISQLNNKTRMEIILKMYNKKKVSIRLVALRLLSKDKSIKAKKMILDATKDSSHVVRALAKRYLAKMAHRKTPPK